ncbi:MAG: small multi-drug export protein [Thermotaleaceae bacterium]
MNKILEFLTKEIMVLMVAAMPVMELRVAIPMGVSMGMSPLHAMVLGIIGSMIPVPFLLMFLKPVFRKLKKMPIFKGFVDWLTNRTMRKTGAIQKYSLWGLLLFVAIPVPTTGVWSGSIAASLLDMRLKYAFVVIFAGNCIAAVIMMSLSHMAVNF